MSRAGAGTETRKLTYLHLSDNGCLSNDVLDEQQSQEVLILYPYLELLLPLQPLPKSTIEA